MKRTPAARVDVTGFTLIELLVVIVILAILGSILLPALANAKAKARTIQCFSHLRQWAHAMHLHSLDSDFIPREGFRSDGTVRRDTWSNVRDKRSLDVWYNVLPSYLSLLPARDFFSTYDGSRPRFYKQRLYHCPGAQFPPHVEGKEDAYFSLTMNSKLITPERLKLMYTWVVRPAATVAFLEARVATSERKVDPNQLDVDLGQPSTYASRFAARHQGRGNLAFLDGSVATMEGNAVVETRSGHGRMRGFAQYPDGQVLWSPNPVIDPNTFD